MKAALTAMLVLLLCACQPADPPEVPEPPQSPTPEQLLSADDTDRAGAPVEETPLRDRLQRVLDAQPEPVQLRYDERHPAATLGLFGIEPGMTVVEVLPGDGWYSRILMPYLGSRGRLIAVDYPLELWANFAFASEEFMAGMRQWPEQFPMQARAWCEQDCAEVVAYRLGSLPPELAATADAVLFVRALHNLARFGDQPDYLAMALAEAHAMLKPGGVLGIVQHEARPDMPDDWADGNNGYLKKRFVIDQVEAAGFERVADSAINKNPNDQPGVDDDVWRLPPSLRIEDDDPMLRERYEAIGESNRMTLKFRKPVEM